MSSTSKHQTTLSVVKAMYGKETLDESLKQVSEMLYVYVTKPSVEIEAKIGLFMSRTTLKRLHIEPRLTSEVIIQKSDPPKYHNDVEFQSTVTSEAFMHLNKFLNSRFQVLREQKDKGLYDGPVLEVERVNELDEFYKVFSDRKNNWVRVSVDPETLERKRAICKDRLFDINFHCPHRMWDYRISVNDELPVDFPDDNIIRRRVRRKNRLSYKFNDQWRIDMTVVESQNCDRSGTIIQDPSEKPTYEIELECNGQHVLNLRNDAHQFFQQQQQLQKLQLGHNISDQQDNNPLDKLTNYSEDLLQQIRSLCATLSSIPRQPHPQPPHPHPNPQQQQQQQQQQQPGRAAKRARNE